MDEFIRKKILYFLKHHYDKDPYHHINLLEHFDTEVSIIERNILYLSQKNMVDHLDTQGHDHVLARITDNGIDFVEEDLKQNHELNVLEFMRENLKKGKIDFIEFPEYLFPDRERLNANLMKYDKTEVAVVHASGFPSRVDVVFPKDTLINRLEDLIREKEAMEISVQRQQLVVNIANIERMEGYQLQQGTIESVQRGSFKIENQKQLLEFIELLKTKLPDLQLSDDDKPEIQADIETIEAQMRSNRPKDGIIKESLLSIKRILEGASGAIIANELLKYLPAFLGG